MRKYLINYGILSRIKDGLSHKMGGFVILEASSKGSARIQFWQNIGSQDALLSLLDFVEKIEIHYVSHFPENKEVPQNTIIF